jgi:hypothetical protein
MTHIKKILIFICVLSLLNQALVCAQNKNILRVTVVGKSSPKITRPAKARAMALRAARVEGYRALARAAGLEKVYRDDSGSGQMEERTTAAFMKGARMVDKRFISDHEVEVTMEIETADIVQMASGLEKERFKETVIKLRNRIKFLEKEMSKNRVELKIVKDILDKLEKKAR